MLTQKEYIQAKQKIEMLKEALSNNGRSALYRNAKKCKVQMEIDRLKAYFMFLEHYEEIVKIVLETDSPREVEEIMRKRFGVTRQQAGAFKYFSLSEFSKKEQKIKEEQLKNLEERLKLYDEE